MALVKRHTMLACLASAMAHLQSGGMKASHLVQALMYNDQSANESLSLSIGFKVLQSPHCNLFVNMNRNDYFYLRRCSPCI